MYPHYTRMEERFTLTIDGQTVPVRLVKERRRNSRIYVGKEEVIIRLPSFLPPTEEEKHRKQLIAWLHKRARKREGLLAHYQTADYQTGDTLRVGQRQYTLEITSADKKGSSGKVRAGIIELSLSDRLNEGQRSEAIRTLLSRVIAADFLPAIKERVHALNAQHFRQPIKEVRLKYNHTNWGSCSTNGNINLSTRLLFAPQEVIDYVIIHELAHRVEPNHSPRFWAQVASAMPTYKEKEAWLTEFGAQCDF